MAAALPANNASIRTLRTPHGSPTPWAGMGAGTSAPATVGTSCNIATPTCVDWTSIRTPSKNDYGAFIPFQQVAPIKPPTTTMPQLNLLNLTELEAIKEHIESLIKQDGAGPLTLPTNMNFAQLANINKQLEAFVQLASTILPILSTFVPQLKILIPILPVLAGLLKMGDDIAQGGNDPAKIADVLAAHLRDVAKQVQALKLPGQS
jgi:hypothetical protein